jgi:sugar phosphate isomerase/epimerase
MHPRLSVTALALPQRPVARDIELFAELGIPHIGVAAWRMAEAGWADSVAALRRSAVPVGYLIHSRMFTLDTPWLWPAERDRVNATLRAAAECGAGVVYTTTGPAGTLTWERAAGALAAAVEPCLVQAERYGVALAFETTCQLRQDLGFVYTLRDQVALAEATGLSICLDLYWCWREPGLLASVAAAVAAERLVLLQVSDYEPGTMSMPFRIVPGDGVVPLEALVRGIHEAGYRGLVDVELLGPRVDTEGAASALSRGAAAVSAMLERLDEGVAA